MKNLFFSLVFLFLLLVVGCQENSITDPVSPGNIQRAANIPEITSTAGSIPLEGILKYPGPGNIYYTLKGSISYNIQLIPGNYVLAEQSSATSNDHTNTNEPTSTTGAYYLRVAMYINATLNNSERISQNVWYVSSTSVNYFYKSVEGNHKLVKSYSIEGRNDNLSLVCQFLVTSHSIKLAGRWLAFVVSQSVNSVR